MNFNQKVQPSVDEAATLISQGINRGHLITLVGRCEVQYDGRTTSFLPPGDRLIVRKADGNFLVHTNENRKPINWQPTGATCEVDTIDENILILHSETTSPAEVIDVRFDTVYTVATYPVVDDHDIEKYGTEAHIQEYLFENADQIEKGFRATEMERKLDVGSIDIFGYDSDGQPAIIEIKRRKAGPDAVQQLRRYVEDFTEESDNADVRGILVAPDVTDSAREQISRYGFTLMDTPDTVFSSEQKTQLTDFS